MKKVIACVSVITAAAVGIAMAGWFLMKRKKNDED